MPDCGAPEALSLTWILTVPADAISIPSPNQTTTANRLPRSTGRTTDGGRLGVSMPPNLKPEFWAEWPPERVARLRLMLHRGMTDAAIAEALGVTLRALQGKRQRLGL